jgi:hypothetical protein
MKTFWVVLWLTAHANTPATTWWAPFCGEEIQALGRSTVPGPIVSPENFEFSSKLSATQHEYLVHWMTLARHCLQSLDDACAEAWNFPCCDGEACKPTS